MLVPRTYLGKETKSPTMGPRVGPGGCNRTLAGKQKYWYCQIVTTHQLGHSLTTIVTSSQLFKSHLKIALSKPIQGRSSIKLQTKYLLSFFLWMTSLSQICLLLKMKFEFCRPSRETQLKTQLMTLLPFMYSFNNSKQILTYFLTSMDHLN